ncbi:MAG: type II toxin-antitoxin system death-on-curing family toxin [Marivita sp.]|uniref:type II toxin-antitoxin system death-on-curing family toxin n=1 Tax=Marivita sp. TaxID=2003365 RepID=UPI0025BBCDA6|nr:type II toxin-antitoxin system death-on-curing family toxin [Marivita sp.]MCI5109412.1 type II toxin-antitoxin system death-on-curing family toxin [Marivita sp.]
MTFSLLSTEVVIALHDAALNDGEIPGLAKDKSLDGALRRVDNRLVYGMIGDVFDLAAAYATAISRGHCFNDGNKRTAFESMNFCLYLHGINITWDTEDVGDRIIALAQGVLQEEDLADWLRIKAR